MSNGDKTQVLPDIGGANVGTQLSGIYELDERIASGGMGEVYRGHNIQTQDPVAIKIVLPEFARDPMILSLFRKEASILFHLSHDAIVRYHVFSVDPAINRPYLAMEFVNGVSLVDIMERGPMDPAAVQKLCTRIASGLAAAHEAGIIHRDLSPDNIILPGGKVERAKIIDFGIARSATVGGETLLGGKFAGKYNYVSPEQLGLFGGEVTEQSDIYSFGLVLAAVLRGSPLDMSGSQVDVIDKRRKVPDLDGVAAGFVPLLSAMLQPEPKDRPASMEEVVARAGAMVPGPAATATPQVAISGDAPAPPPTAAPAARDAVAPAGPDAPVQAAADVWSAAGDQRTRLAGAPPVEAVPPKAQATHQPAAARGGAPAPSAPERPPSESPFGPYVPPAPESPFTRGVSIGMPAQPSPGDAGKRRRSRAALAGAAAVAVLMLGGGAAFLSGVFGDRTQPPAAPASDSAPTPAETPAAPASVPEPAAAPPDEPEPPTAPPTEPSAAPAEQSPPATEPTTQPLEPQGTPSESEPPAGQNAETPPGSVTQEPAVTPLEEPPPVQTTDLPAVIDHVAQRVTWLRDYAGGPCFYATATAITDKSTDIEGFGTSIEPFARMLDAFKAAFGMEPDVSVRLLEPQQCVVADFLRGVSSSGSAPPDFELDQTQVANGGTLSGRIVSPDGRKTDLVLIDHKGMAYNLNSRLTASGETETFSIKLGLGAADLAKQASVPQVVLAIRSRDGVPAANFTGSIPAEELLPKILSEMTGTDATATAKYFKLGG